MKKILIHCFMFLVKTPSPLFQKQIAPTLAALLGFHFVPDKGDAAVISTIVSR